MSDEKKPRFGKWTRRAFIGAGAVAGGGLVLGVGGIAFAPNRLHYVPEGEAGEGRLTTWIRITPDNVTTIFVPHCEMGQGAIVGIGMLCAEELEADWPLVRVVEAPAEDIYANGYVVRAYLQEVGWAVPGWLERAVDFGSFKMAEIVGMQVTGGSTSTRGTGVFGLRVAGAAAKVMLLEAASQRFGVPVAELRARRSRVEHAATGRSATYGELATLAATLDVPRRPPLESREEWELVGTPQPRPDIPSKVVGEARYGIDVTLPDMLHAAIVKAPVPGGLLAEVDPAPAEALPGVHRVVRLPDAVAVVADGWWQARRALDALQPRFTDGGVGDVDTAAIRAAHAAALDAEAADLGGAQGRSVSAEYEVPYLAHATMEPMCATARVADGRCEVWAGTQDPLDARGAAARAASLDEHLVTVHNQHLGGGFGRRLPGTFDYVEQAVQIAAAVSPRPVKLIWSREEDMRHGYYRPFVLARMHATLDERGRPLSWVSRFTGGFGDASAAAPPYAIDEKDVRAVEPPVHLRTGAWRSVASSQHGFFMESFVDELAHAASEDPVAYRLALLEDAPRHRAVLERVAEMSGWGGPLPEGRARGCAIVESFGSIVAQVAEVGLDARGGVRVHRMYAAVDCGLAVNPQQAEAQVQGGIIFGLSAALFHEITVKDGAVVERNFPDYDMLRLANAPRIEISFVDTGGPIGGLGEPPVPPVAPAVANALFALTGRRHRKLPFRTA